MTSSNLDGIMTNKYNNKKYKKKPYVQAEPFSGRTFYTRGCNFKRK